MTDIEVLSLLADFHDSQSRMAHWLHGAMQLESEGDDARAWLYLFEWAEAKSERDQIFGLFKDHYSYAVLLREGHQ